MYKSAAFIINKYEGVPEFCIYVSFEVKADSVKIY